ncbi:twin-arginine translocase subunit TatC [Alteribacillus bidgolensis]
MFLTAVGLVTPRKLRESRKYGYILIAIVSALITPPDLISQLNCIGTFICLIRVRGSAF